MGDSLENMHQGDATDTFEEDPSDPVREGQTMEVESQDAGEDTGYTDQDVEVEEDDRSRDLTSSEVEDKDEDLSDRFLEPELDSNRSFNPDNFLLRTDSSSGSLKDAESRYNALSQDHRGRIPTHAAENIGPPKTKGVDSPVEVQRSFSHGPDSGEGCFLHPELSRGELIEF